jgi:hypothetical protein
MARNSIAEAMSKMPELIGKTLARGEVTLTRDGEEMVDLRPSAGRSAPPLLGEAPLMRLQTHTCRYSYFAVPIRSMSFFRSSLTSSFSVVPLD